MHDSGRCREVTMQRNFIEREARACNRELLRDEKLYCLQRLEQELQDILKDEKDCQEYYQSINQGFPSFKRPNRRRNDQSLRANYWFGTRAKQFDQGGQGRRIRRRNSMDMYQRRRNKYERRNTF